MLTEIQPRWVDTPDDVRWAADVCAATGRFAFDTEADSLHSYFHKVCLLQVSANGRHVVIDPLALDAAALEPLWRLVADPAVPVIMHGADYDIRILDRDFGTRVRGLQDTQIMAQLLGEEKTGLGSLLEREFGVRLDKRHQRADWGRRPLPPKLLGYAAADTAFLPDLAGRLRSRLEELDRWAWALEEFRRQERVRHEPPEEDPLAFDRIKGARSLQPAARDRLCELSTWRDEQARTLDLPPFKIVGNRQMVLLAADPPADLEEMALVPGLGPRFTRRWGRDVLRRLRRPRRAPPRARPPRRPPMSGPVRRRAKRLIEARDAAARELKLPPGLLCPRALVETIANEPPGRPEAAGEGLTGWRRGVLGERFRRILAEG